MWVVRLALQRPHTFLVMALLIVLMGVFSIRRTPTDILPNINIPVVSVIWNYAGMPPQGMADHITTFTERVASTTVNDIEHVESQSLNGIAVVKYFFQPRVNEDLAVAQITSVSQTLLRQMPPGTTPPFILAYNASSVPVIQLALASSRMTEGQIFDFGNNFIRTQLATVAGASLPYPFGGRMRQVQVDLEPEALRNVGLSANDVTRALALQNLIVPAGTEKIAHREYVINLNASFSTIDQLNDIPLKTPKGGLIHLRDVAHVYDGAPPQTNVVRVDGRRAVLMSVLKTGTASTLDIIDSIKGLMPQVRADMPPQMDIHTTGDQSLFVRAAIDSVVREGLIAAALTGTMILLFLGSWRSTLIITVSIPLSVLSSLMLLSALGETINIMTLGGLALAVGVLVDDATVTIENINWHLEQGKDTTTAILDGARQIAMPSLVSTLAICIVFIPMFLLTGVAHYLFVPLAEAVVFAMLASWILSRTLVPTLAMYWLKPHGHGAPGQHWGARLHQRFENGFQRMRQGYHRHLEQVLRSRPKRFLWVSYLLIALSLGLFPWIGQDFFPEVDAGQIKLHLRAPTGTRIEDTTALCDAVEQNIRQHLGRQLESQVDVVGLPYSGINLSYSTSAPIGSADADIFITLKSSHTPTPQLVHELRQRLRSAFPGVTFAFLPADIVSQILNFGLPAPLDVQITGLRLAENQVFANQLLTQLKTIPGATDLRIQQPFDNPQIDVNINRDLAQTLGFTEQDIATNLMTTLSGSFQTSPSFWTNPKNGVQYNVSVQSPQYRLQSLDDLKRLPITGAAPGTPPQLLANLASFQHNVGPGVVSHYNVKPVIDIFGSVQDTDLGTVAHQIQQIVDRNHDKLPKGTRVMVRGQVQTMHESFSSLMWGLMGAVVLVYLLIVVNFQSWLYPLIILGALPAALAGMVWMLFLTHTTLSVPALTGAIMCMGVGAANSILVVSFAKERLQDGLSALEAALEAGSTRLRPVLMTALAMIIGMLPMALGLGEGGEQNAPLGRTVIGGLMLATLATLWLVPILFSLIPSNSHSRTHEVTP